MTTLAARPGTAVVIVDVQVGVVADAYDRDGVLARIAALVGRARATGVPVVWVQDHASRPIGSDAWQLVPELDRAPDEPRVDKLYGDAFEETDLESVLAGLGAGRLVVAGAQTDQCIRSTLHGALVRGYDAVLVADAHTTEDLTAYGAPPPEQVIAHTNLYWTYQQAPGRTAGTATAALVDLGA